MSLQDCSLHPLLLDARYWRERLEAVRQVPRHLLVFPRPDLARAGAEVNELWIRAHDGLRLHALVARTQFVLCVPRLVVQLESNSAPFLEPSAVDTPENGSPTATRFCHSEPTFDWERVLEGEVQMVLPQPASRRLEDRVWDLVRIVSAARRLTGLETSRIELLGDSGDGQRDEIRIASRLFDEGWAG